MMTTHTALTDAATMLAELPPDARAQLDEWLAGAESPILRSIPERCARSPVLNGTGPTARRLLASELAGVVRRGAMRDQLAAARAELPTEGAAWAILAAALSDDVGAAELAAVVILEDK